MRFLFGLSIWLLSVSTFAFNCEGYLTQVAVSNGGEVRINADFTKTYTTVCNTKGTWNSVDTVTCMAWFSQIQTAYSNNKKLLVMYPDLTDEAGETYTCDTMPYYGKALKPNFVINVQHEVQ